MESTPFVPVSEVPDPTVAPIPVVQAPPPPQQDPSSSSVPAAPLDDVIDGIRKLSLEGNEEPPQLVKQPETSQKIPKWLSKTLESNHPDEVGKTRTKSPYRDRLED